MNSLYLDSRARRRQRAAGESVLRAGVADALGVGEEVTEGEGSVGVDEGGAPLSVVHAPRRRDVNSQTPAAIVVRPSFT